MQCETKLNNRNLTILRTLTVMVALFFSINYGQIASAAEKQKEISTSVQQASGNVSKSDLSPIETLQKISQAQTNGKYVFLLFYEPDNSDCQTMAQRLDEFAKHTDRKVEIVKIDRTDPNNGTIVASMKAQSAPVPLTLVKDTNGRVVKYFTTAVSEEEIRYAIPSPKKEAAINDLQNGKSLIVCFTDSKMAMAADVDKQCEEAEKKLAGKTEYIKVDLSDPKEAGFIKELNIDPNTQAPVTVVVNSSRQTTGRYSGSVKVDDLVQSATKIAAGGCCGGGSGKSCGPAKQ